jgi:trans-aconitate 2-methyltransferase
MYPVDPDHKNLIEELLCLLNKNGVLAVQIPMNSEEPIHRIISEMATSEKWKEYFTDPSVSYTLSQGEFYLSYRRILVFGRRYIVMI